MKEVIKILAYILVIAYGLVIGSFLNVCVYRIPLSQSIVYPPSNCTNCNSKLKWNDLIPVFSYIFLRGKCRYCGSKISIRYPIQELLTAIIFLATYLHYGLSLYFIKFVILFCFLIVISNIDIKFQDVYIVTTIPGIVIGTIFAVVEKYLYSASLGNYLLGAIIAGGIISIVVYSTGAMGKGDIEIALLCGIFLGWKYSLIMIVLSFVSGGIIGVMLIVFKIKGRKDYIAFGPYLALGTLLVIFFGNNILNWYLQLFF
ncbi:prepilin peptidase [Clostridium sp. UBA4548]|uniref:prepilin peptidase n=1 Tax=Clostridium sp. UBA4548 TaxID=1946361 RepID=UPI0025C2FBDA|nr:A24 family peptidase [Clostridium sp. UBA4548]